jgi:Protein of unknown function with HXXEE motif
MLKPIFKEIPIAARPQETGQNSVAYWFGWIVLINALHMLEQLMFGVGELANLKRILAVYYAWFPQPDYGTVVLVTIVSTLAFALIYGILAGGRRRQIAVGALALIALGEVHHFIETAQTGRYNPGSVTAIPYIASGVLLLRALISERCGKDTAEHRAGVKPQGAALAGVTARRRTEPAR